MTFRFDDLYSRPPGGKCAACPARATRWIVRAAPIPGGTAEVGLGVCDGCAERLLPASDLLAGATPFPLLPPAENGS